MSIDGFSDVSSARLANILNMRLILTAVAVTNIAVPSFAGAPELVGTTIVSGFEPHIEASGLKPGQRVRVHAVRMFSTWERAPTGGWRQAPKPLHSWADFLADEEGRIRLWRASPLSGTYAGIDGYGLLWSGRAIKADAPNPHLPADISFKDMKDGETTIILADGDAVLAHRPLTTASAPGIRVVDVAKGRINGAYAAPADGKRHPALILLHGSEGGDRDAARSLAIRFAGQGYAAFSFNYFAWDLKKLVGVPNAHVNQPIEMISAVRDWLKEQPEADVNIRRSAGKVDPCRMCLWRAIGAATITTVISTKQNVVSIPKKRRRPKLWLRSQRPVSCGWEAGATQPGLRAEWLSVLMRECAPKVSLTVRSCMSMTLQATQYAATELTPRGSGNKIPLTRAILIEMPKDARLSTVGIRLRRSFLGH